MAANSSHLTLNFDNIIEQLETNTFSAGHQNEEINRVLDWLNSVKDFEINGFSNDKLSRLISTLSQAIPISNSNNHLLSKFCHFVFSSAHHDQIIFHHKSLENLVAYFLQAINISLDWVVPDILNALSTVMYLNVEQLSQFWDVLVGPSGTLIRLYDRSKTDIDMRIAVLRCLQNICVRKSNEPYLLEDHAVACIALFIDSLQEGIKCDIDSTDIFKLKMILTSLHGVRNLLMGFKKVPGSFLGEILGIMRTFMFIGLQNGATLKYSCLYPAPVSQGMPHVKEERFAANRQPAQQLLQEKSSNHKKRVRKKRLTPQKIPVTKSAPVSNLVVEDETFQATEIKTHFFETNVDFVQDETTFSNLSWMCSSSSDSELSDSEHNHVAKVRNMQAKIRSCAYKVLQATNWVTEKKTMFGYWSSFLPNIPGPSTATHEQTVLVTILKDPSAQVRGAAYSFLTDLFEGSKLFLSIADENLPQRTSFIPMSFTLAEVIRELHRSLLLSLCAENSANLITQVLKCYTRLVENVQYHRLKPDLLINILDQIYEFLIHKDVQAQVAALTLLGAIVRVQHSNGNIESFFFTKSTSYTSKLWQRCWVVEFCSDHVKNEACGNMKPPVPVLIEIIQLLTSFLCNYHKQLKSFMSDIKEIILRCIKDTNASIQFHGVKAFDVMGKVTLEGRISENENKTDLKEIVLKDLEIWRDFLSGPLTNLLQNPANHPTRALCCDCLSNIGDDVFQLLPHQLQATCITLLLGLVHDENANVRGSAIRCLGIYALYPSLQDTFTFLMDVGDSIIILLSDPNNNTCLKASWALGNLSDALVMKREELLDLIPSSFISSLGLAALKASKGQDKIKIRTNTVRAIGNLLNYIPASAIDNEDMITFINDSVALLLLCLGKSTMKVQWNACYALGTMLKNKDLMEKKIVNLSEVIQSLLITVRSSNNFKVQINAISSMTTLSLRSDYENELVEIWLCLLESLNVTQKSVDYKEIKHRDMLCEQIIVSIGKMIILLHPEDVLLLNEIVISSMELLLEVAEKVAPNLSPDKMEIFQNAEFHLNKLEDSMTENHEAESYSNLGLLKIAISTLLETNVTTNK